MEIVGVRARARRAGQGRGLPCRCLLFYAVLTEECENKMRMAAVQCIDRQHVAVGEAIQIRQGCAYNDLHAKLTHTEQDFCLSGGRRKEIRGASLFVCGKTRRRADR